MKVDKYTYTVPVWGKAKQWASQYRYAPHNDVSVIDGLHI